LYSIQRFFYENFLSKDRINSDNDEIKEYIPPKNLLKIVQDSIIFEYTYDLLGREILRKNYPSPTFRTNNPDFCATGLYYNCETSYLNYREVVSNGTKYHLLDSNIVSIINNDETIYKQYNRFGKFQVNTYAANLIIIEFMNELVDLPKEVSYRSFINQDHLASPTTGNIFDSKLRIQYN